MLSDDNDLAARIQEAIEDGEILRVRYDHGSQPGTVRDIRPVSVLGDRTRAHDEASTVPKVFILKYLEIVGSDEPTTYIARKTKRKTIPGPTYVTDGWHFFAPMPTFAPAFDIAHSARKRVDLHTQKKVTIRVWTQGDPPAYQFAEGDVFHHPVAAATDAWGSVEEHSCMQILEADEESVEIAFMAFRAGAPETQARKIKLSMEDFLGILRDGPNAPQWAKILHATQRRHESD